MRGTPIRWRDGHDRLRPRPSRRRGQLDVRVDGPGVRRGPPGRPRGVHERRARRVTRRPADGELLVDRRRAETEARRRSSACTDRLARLRRLGDDRMGPERRSGVVPAGRPRRGRRAAGHDPREEHADVVVLYDWHGVYGHPDHVQVHRVGHRAADSAGTPRRFEVTFNRDVLKRLDGGAPGAGAEDFDPEGRPTTATRSAHRRRSCTSPSTSAPYIAAKRRARLPTPARSPTSAMFLAMPEDVFALWRSSTEWYIEPGRRAGSPRRLAAGGHLMARVHLVRHGRAAAGWDVDPDPGLDAVGRGAGLGGRRRSRRWPAGAACRSSPARCGVAGRRRRRWPCAGA